MIDIICHKHGKFQQKANSHLRGYGCKYCHYDKVKINFKKYNHERIKKASEAFIQKAEKIHEGRRYDYSLAKYIRGHDKITVICPEHGQFRPTAFNHLAGQICPECSESGFNPKRPATLYYIKINDENQNPLYKIGITNRKIRDRYSAPIDKTKIRILKTWNYLFGFLAQEKEKEIIKANQKYLYQGPPPLIRAGIKEIFNRDILKLDNSLSGGGGVSSVA